MQVNIINNESFIYIFEKKCCLFELIIQYVEMFWNITKFWSY